MNWEANWKGSHFSQNFWKRLPSLLVVGVCIGLVLWSVLIRLSLVTEAQSHMYSSFSLTRELERLRISWFQDDADRMMQDWKQFQARNFNDYDQVMLWVSRFSTRAQALGLEVTYKIGEEGEPVAGVPSVTPVTIQYSLHTESEQATYADFMRFIKEVTQTDLAVTLDKIELSGTGRNIQKLELGLTAYMNQGT